MLKLDKNDYILFISISHLKLADGNFVTFDQKLGKLQLRFDLFQFSISCQSCTSCKTVAGWTIEDQQRRLKRTLNSMRDGGREGPFCFPFFHTNPRVIFAEGSAKLRLT